MNEHLPHDPQRKKEEFRTWFFLTVVMAPVLSVLIVSAYGFLVWFWQLIAGPPSG
jgi:periplasmic nitrate reductase NapE